MRTAMVLMTILGCDDSATDCQYVATLNQRWPSVELCNAVSEKELSAFANISYPVVIAVCQDPTATADAGNRSGTASAPAPQAVEKAQAATPEEERAEERSLATKAMDRIKSIMPTKQDFQDLIKAPVGVVEDGYSWVAKRLH